MNFNLGTSLFIPLALWSLGLHSLAGCSRDFDNVFDEQTDSQNPVTFSVDMTLQTALGNFDATSDIVVIRGSFQVEAGDTGDWQGGMFKMADGDADGIYDLVVVFDDTSVRKTFEYKFVTNEDGWEVISDNRLLTLIAGGNTLDTVFFNDMSTTTITF